MGRTQRKKLRNVRRRFEQSRRCKRCESSRETPQLVVPLVEGMYWRNVIVEVLQWGVQGHYRRRRGHSKDLYHEGNTEGVEEEQDKPCPDEPVASASARGGAQLCVSVLAHGVILKPARGEGKAQMLNKSRFDRIQKWQVLIIE